MRPEHFHYDCVEHWIQVTISSGDDFLYDPDRFRIELHNVSTKTGFPYESLLSFFRNKYLGHIKRTAHRVRATLPRYLEEYKRGKRILHLAREANFSPHLFARQLLELVIPKNLIGDATRDPVGVMGSPSFPCEMDKGTSALILSRLATEVKEAQDADPLHGPENEKRSHLVGVEYEVVLELQLRALVIPFETEATLRDRGTSRTPDVLLTFPVGIQVPRNDGAGMDWRMICWIDSKAMFGDAYTHHASVLPQAEAFVHRFGPGLIVYWFGHAPPERLADAKGDIVIAGWELPKKFRLPTGEVLLHQS